MYAQLATTPGSTDYPFHNYSGSDIPANAPVQADTVNVIGSAQYGIGIIALAALGNPILGFTTSIIPAGGNGPVRCFGPICQGVADGAITAGGGVDASVTASRSVKAHAGNKSQIGYALSTAIDGESILFMLGGSSDVLAELYQNLYSIKKVLPIPLTSCIDAVTGAPLLVFADAAAALPGIQLTNSKAVSVRWNNHAAPTAIAVTVPVPLDYDDTALVTFRALVSKIGATLGDATSLTVGAFEQVAGALHDADVDFGGATGAVVGDATSKTVSMLSRTLAAADVNPAPLAWTFTIKPTAGLLGTDDFCLHACWLEYKGKLLTS